MHSVRGKVCIDGNSLEIQTICLKLDIGDIVSYLDLKHICCKNSFSDNDLN